MLISKRLALGLGLATLIMESVVIQPAFAADKVSLFKVITARDEIVIGIPEGDIGKLGRPFEQVENQFSKSHQGSGLGLAISRALVELHGGTVRISSREGQGTTVTCTLPVQAVLPAETSEPELAASA